MHRCNAYIHHSINRTIFGIETRVKFVWLHGSSIPINRTIFGIETKKTLPGPGVFSQLSIAPSLELKRKQISHMHALFKRYQSHHLWNWNTDYPEGWEPYSVPLSIAPSLELKRVQVNARNTCFHPINRTIFGIETSKLIRCWMDPLLSIAPSLELKRYSGRCNLASRDFYQSHHLWNWNIILECCIFFLCRLSIAPSLELKRMKTTTIAWLCITINRTIFGIETVQLQGTELDVKLYQSHHLWNWNNIILVNKYGIVCTINRTIFGIETQDWCRIT